MSWAFCYYFDWTSFCTRDTYLICELEKEETTDIWKKKTGQSLNRFKISLIYYHFPPCYLFVFILLDSSHDCDLFKMLNWKRSQNLTIIFMSSMIHWYDCNLFKILWQQQQKCLLVFKLCLEWCLKGVWTPCLKKYLMYFHWQFCLKSMWNSNPKYSWVKI